MTMLGTRLVMLIGGLGFLAVPLLFTGSFFKFLLILVFIYTIVSIGLNLLIGYAGQFSLGHAGLMAIGAYVSAIVSQALATIPALVLVGGNVWIGMVSGIIAAGIAGAALAFPALRLKGPYLAMVTVAFGWVVWKILLTWTSVTGGDLGITAIPRPRVAGHIFNVTDYYYLSGVIAVIALLLQRNLVASDFGRKIRAMKFNEAALASVGVDVHREKVVVFVISAMFAGCGGALFAHLQNFINPDNFQFFNSVFFLLTILFGGPGTLSGPIFGATLLTLVPELLHGAEQYRLLIFSVLILVTLFYLPHGVAGLLPARLGQRTPDPGSDRGTRPRKPTDAVPAALSIQQSASDVQSPIVSIRGVSKSFGGIVALNEVDLAIAPGTVHALIGPNGAGKTTLVNIVSGLYRPDRGAIEILGIETRLSSLHDAARQGIARTFQTIKLFGSMTAREHVMVGCEMQSGAGLFDALFRTRRSRDEEQRRRAIADELLTLVGLYEFSGAPADSLAYGHRRLLEVARALAARPRLLLLDEPAAGLVASEIEMLAGVIDRLRASGLAVLLVEHHMDLVIAVSDTITVLEYGRVISRGDVETVRNDPVVVEAYLGTGGEHELSAVAG
jgi:ABC-type branched-subunit amino acid transport system ATPase component/ABC-type branched-subunit amino acid transport system permease subunit